MIKICIAIAAKLHRYDDIDL